MPNKFQISKFQSSKKDSQYLFIKKQDGFFAVTSAIILSVLVLMIAVSLSIGGFNARFTSLSFESKDKSYYLARGCLEEAVIKYRETSTYAGNETLTIDNKNCVILPFTASGADQVITTEATSDNRQTNLESLYDSANNILIYTRELEQ